MFCFLFFYGTPELIDSKYTATWKMCLIINDVIFESPYCAAMDNALSFCLTFLQWSLTHFQPMFDLCRNQVVGFYYQNIWKTPVEEWYFK